MSDARMVYVSPGRLDSRAIDGLNEFAKTWPGEIVVVSGWEERTENEFSVVTATDVPATVRDLRPSVITALHRPEFAYLAGIARTVYTSETTWHIRAAIQRAGNESRVDQLRVTVGQWRHEREFRAMAEDAAGLQCNGFAAWDAYAGYNRRPMRFREHRIRAIDLAAARNRSVWDGASALRVAFSGRLVAIKGPRTVLAVAARLPQMEFTILGDGELRTELERQAPSNVRFIGMLPFSAWPAFVRENVDVALLPHPQGDPSGTYHEMLGCGVPVVGLANRTWRRLADVDGLGWAASDTAGLIRTLGHVTPADLARARASAFEILEPFEVVAAARMMHLVNVLGS